LLAGLELLIALVIVTVGALVMGTVSFGLGLVVAPVLLLFVDPQSVVVIVNTLIGILLLAVLIQTRRHLDLGLVLGMTLGGLVAVPIGVLALDSASPATLRITIALVILGLAPLTLWNIKLPFFSSRYSAPFVGFLTSLSIAALSIGGPLAAIYVIAQRWPPQVIRATLASYFLLINIFAFALYARAGLVHRDTLGNIGILLPGLLVGFGLATLVVRRMDAEVFRYVALAVIVVGGVVLLGREIMRL
jgi:uncharacterized membrane protein YfcA